MEDHALVSAKKDKWERQADLREKQNSIIAFKRIKQLEERILKLESSLRELQNFISKGG